MELPRGLAVRGRIVLAHQPDELPEDAAHRLVRPDVRRAQPVGHQPAQVLGRLHQHYIQTLTRRGNGGANPGGRAANHRHVGLLRRP